MSFLKRINTRGIGFITGLLVPILTFVIYGFSSAGDIPFSDWMNKMWENEKMRSNTLTLILIPSLFIFYLANFRWRLDHLTVGLVGATLILSVVIISLIVL